jgi:hypothetical protein
MKAPLDGLTANGNPAAEGLVSAPRFANEFSLTQHERERQVDLTVR